MRASESEFRLRTLIITAIVVVGFWAPWAGPWNSPERISTLWWLTHGLGSMGGVAAAAPLVNVLGALLALAGAALRVWGSAYLGYLTVHNSQMQAGNVMADGPYRYMRNPLYLGAWFAMAATALIMPPTGALFTMVMLPVFYLRLTLGEEAFLSATLGQPYSDYRTAVPRFIPRWRSSLPPAGNKPNWRTAIFTELYPIGVFLTFGVLAWRYDNQLMLEGIFWSFIVSALARGIKQALIPTLAFVVFFAIATEWYHMYWPKAALIGFGIALIVRAIFFGVRKPKQPHSA